MKRLVVTAIASMMLMAAGSANAAPGIKEGRWSMTMTIQGEGMEEAAEAMRELENMSAEDKAMMEQMMGGMKFGVQGGGAGMTTTSTQCMTNEQPVPRREEQRDCQETHSMRGNTVNFKVVCPDGTSSGHVTYQHDTMKGRITSTQTNGGHASDVTIDISGRYMGPCE